MRGQHQRLQPTLVTFTEQLESFAQYHHGGSELIYMLYGTMEYACGQSRFVLEAGDTLQFQGDVSHGATQLLQLPIQFVSIKGYGIVRDPIHVPSAR